MKPLSPPPLETGIDASGHQISWPWKMWLQALYYAVQSGQSGTVISGSVGVPGLNGLDGQDGDDGQPVPGPVGPAGIQGLSGVPVYLEAEQGEQGDMGPQGSMGPQGITGITGTQGPVGPAVYLESPEPDEPVFMGGPTVPVNGSLTWSVPVTKTADFTLGVFDTYVINNKAAATCTVTLPSASGYPGRSVTFKNYQAFTVVSASSNVVPPAGGSAGTAILAASIGGWATLVSDGTNWINVLSAPNNILLLE